MLAGMGPRRLPYLLLDMDTVLKTCGVLSVVSAIIGFISLRAGARSGATVGFAGAFAWGLVGSVLGTAGARSMLINMPPPISFAVYAPNYAAALLVLLIGLTGALVGLALLSRRRAR